MNPDKIWESVSRIYDQVEIILWALLLLGSVWFFVLKLPETWARADRIRAQEIATEISYYCEKLGMKVGTHNYERCLLDLGEFRLMVEKRIAAEEDF